MGRLLGSIIFHGFHFSKSLSSIASFQLCLSQCREVIPLPLPCLRILGAIWLLCTCIIALVQSNQIRVQSKVKDICSPSHTKINRMGKTRDLFKKIRDTKGTFHAKMGTIHDRNGKDLTEAEEIKKRWHEYTEKLYKKGLNDLDNHDGVVTHLEPDILECKVKLALGSITMNKAGGGDGIPVELFQILKDDAVKVLHSICQQIWKTQQWP